MLTHKMFWASAKCAYSLNDILNIFKGIYLAIDLFRN